MITLIGSQGNVDFNSDGTRVLNGENTAYPDITAININEWTNRYPEESLDRDCAHDILDFGTYYVDGTYDPPCEDWRNDREERMGEVHWETCPDCEGTGKIEIYYEHAGCMYGLSNEDAERFAGTVHHLEECELCNGTGEVEVEE